MSRLVALAACLLCVGAAEPPESDATRERVLELLEQASSYLEEDAPKRKAAKDALVEIGAPAVRTLVSRLDTPNVMTRIALVDVLPRIGEPAVDALHEAFRSPKSVLERRRVASLISEIASARSQAVLTEASHDADWAVRASAAAGLGKLAAHEPTAREHLLALVEDDDWSVRLRAVLALGDAGVGDDVETVAARLRDRHFAVRLAAAEVLGDLGRRAVGPIAAQLERTGASRVERLTCLQALARTKHPAAAVYIEPYLIAPHWLVRSYAAEAYGATAAASGAVLCKALLEAEGDANVQRALTEAIEAIEARAAGTSRPAPAK